MEEIKMTEENSGNVTRRNFIKGVIAAGAPVSSASYLFRTTGLSGQAAGTGRPGSVGRLLTLNVNGQERRVDVMKQETLAMTLRYKLGLTGTKLGCDRAECGACTVLVDEVPRYSCSTLTHSVRGKKIVTIEGLAAADGKLPLSPMPRAGVLRIDPSAALAMPGVKGIITEADLPGAQAGAELGENVRASAQTERGLTMEPLYEGEPILALAAVDELTATE